MSKRLVVSVVALLAGLTLSPVLGAQTAASKAVADSTKPDKWNSIPPINTAYAGKKSAPAPEARSAAEIKADIDEAQLRLASNVDELSERISPEQLAQEAVQKVKDAFINEDGSPKPKPIAIVAGSVVGLVVLRAIFHR